MRISKANLIAIWFLVTIMPHLAPANADIQSIDPFVGDRSEPLNFGFTAIVARFEIFQGAGALASFDGHTTVIHLLFADTFAGDTVTPRTGPNILGFTQGPGIFEFDPPVQRFGGYFNNNSGADDATVDFRDVSGNLIGTRIASTPAPGNQWVWNGWESDTPVSRVAVTGNGVIHGFLWFDDMEISTVPSPGGTTLLLVAAGLLRRRRIG
jgi:hypothetical protein